MDLVKFSNPLIVYGLYSRMKHYHALDYNNVRS